MWWSVYSVGAAHAEERSDQSAVSTTAPLSGCGVLNSSSLPQEFSDSTTAVNANIVLCIYVVLFIGCSSFLRIDKYRMYNLYAIFAKLLNICKQIAGNLVNESGNVPRRGVVPKFSDLIETLFSQLCDQFMIIRNYAKDTDGLFARIIGKISALTILQYINYKNEKPIGRVKYALF